MFSFMWLQSDVKFIFALINTQRYQYVIICCWQLNYLLVDFKLKNFNSQTIYWLVGTQRIQSNGKVNPLLYNTFQNHQNDISVTEFWIMNTTTSIKADNQLVIFVFLFLIFPLFTWRKYERIHIYTLTKSVCL